MFRNTYQKGFLSVFSSTGSKPLANWSMHVKNGHIKRRTDSDLNSLVLELIGVNVATTYICTPCPGYCSLAIKLPFLTLIVKNLRKFFTFEIQILDDRNQLRRFRVSNYQSTTRVKPFLTSMPLCLSPGWNQIQFNLADFVRRAYGTSYIETVRIQMHANVLLRRIFFSDRLYPEEEKPAEYRLFKSIQDIQKPKRVPKLPKLLKQEEPIARPVSPITIIEAEEEIKSIKLDEDEVAPNEIKLEEEPIEEETKEEKIIEERQEVEDEVETPGPLLASQEEKVEEETIEIQAEPELAQDEVDKALSKVSFRPEIEETIPENVVQPEEELI